MARRKIIEIEKEENRGIAELVAKLVGDRSYKQAGEDAGIDPSTFSNICRGKVKPTPDILAAITKPEAKPQGGIGLEELMIECGYQNATMERLSAYAEALGGIPIEKVDFGHEVSLREQRLKFLKDTAKRILLESIVDKGYGIVSLETEVGNRMALAIVDLKLKLATEANGIKEWEFVYDFTNSAPIGGGFGYRVLGKMMYVGIKNPDQKVSIVVDEETKFRTLARLSGKLPFRGELSVVFLDFESGAIKGETYLSHYECDNNSREIYLV